MKRMILLILTAATSVASFGQSKQVRDILLNDLVLGGPPATIPVGTIFTQSPWTNLTNYAQSGSSFSVVSNELNMTGGIASFGDRLEYNSASNSYRYTCLEKWSQRVVVRTPSTVNGASTYGIGIGINSTGAEDYSCIVRWIWDTAQNGQLVRYVQRGFTNQVYSGAGNAFVPVANTTYVITLERNKTALTYTIKNSTETVTHLSYTFNWDLSTGYVQSPNTGRWGLWNFGGTNIRITEWTVSSTAQRNVDYVAIGDSNMSGLWAVTTSGRYVEQAMATKGKTYEILAGIADRTADLVLRAPEVVALNPRYVYINIGSNDIANGVASGTWQANINSLISTFEGAGITVILGTPVARNVDLTAAQTFINGKSQLKYDFFGLTKNAGNTALQAAYGGGVDGIHMNLAGNNACATALVSVMP